MSNALNVTINDRDEQTTTASIEGRVDSETYTQLESLLEPVIDKAPAKVLVDMSQCDYVSSAGIRVFFDFRKKLNEKRSVISFANLQPQIQKVFEIVKALPLECVFSTTEEADAYLDRMMSEELKKQAGQ